jgi:ABC-type nitrate/sulfonate/bicarbonate transport system ATPase subunit
MQYERHERLLTIDSLNLQYGDKVILRDINLCVDNITRPGVSQGQVVALLGPSGCGKTQLFRCIAGMQQSTSGRVLIGEKQLQVNGGDVGVVQQAYPLFVHRTVLSNLQLAARRLGKNANDEIDKLLGHFGLQDKKGAYPSELSGGQRQRIAIIQQLLCSSYFLLMDEPFSGLDVMAKERVFDTIRTVSLTHEHNTLIFTTHDLEAAVSLADEIWVLGREPEKPGATVVKRVDLAAAGLAWTPDIERHPKYWPTILELKELFKTI